MKSFLRIAITMCLALFAEVANGALAFDLTFTDVVKHTGEGFDDPQYGAQARQVLLDSLNETGTMFAKNATLSGSISGSMTTAYYAQSGAASWATKPGGMCLDSSTFFKIEKGQDINGTAADFSMTISYNPTLYPDFTGDGKSDMADVIYNLFGLVRHEAMHVYGISSRITADGSASIFTRSDTRWYDSNGNSYIDAYGHMRLGMDVNDPNAYFLGADGRHFLVYDPGDFSHPSNILYPYRVHSNQDDADALAALGYTIPEPNCFIILMMGATILVALHRPSRSRRLSRALVP
jgi:hypothetical protein